MDNTKTPKYYIEKIEKDIEFCVECLKNVDMDDFNDDEILSSAISFKFVQISENSKKINESIFNEHPEIPWFKISGLRNRIVHDYGSIQLDIIYNTVKNDLPILMDELKKILNEL